MGFDNIEKRSFAYSLLKKILVDPWHNLVYYRKITINFKERIPRDGHLIFTPNHQNALMDAIGPLCNIDKRLVFLARSDIFNKKWIASILYFLKILPVFRIRDGYRSLKNNERIFLKTIDTIKANNGLVILPEGNHIQNYQLRPLKKGFARIAFKAEEENDFKLNLKIVPVGLHYSDYNQIRHELTINFGEPIRVADFIDTYRESPAIAINQLSKTLSSKLKPLMVDIRSEKHYKLIEALKNLYRLSISREKGISEFEAEQMIVQRLEEYEKTNDKGFAKLNNAFQSYLTLLENSQLYIDANLFYSPSPFKSALKIFLAILGLPIFTFGFINNVLPWLLTKKFVKKINDPTFISSFRFVISMVLFPLFYIIQSALFISISGYYLIGILYFISLPLAGIFSWNYRQFFNKMRSVWRIYRFKSSYAMKFAELISSRDNLDKRMKSIYSDT